MILEVKGAPDNSRPIQRDYPSRQFSLIEVYQNLGSEGRKYKGSAIEPAVYPSSTNKCAVFKQKDSLTIFYFSL